MYLRQLESGEQFYAIQAVEDASKEHLYEILRLALWNESQSVRVHAALEIRKEPLPEQAKVWRDWLLDDGQWAWDSDKNYHRVNAQAHIRDVMLQALEPIFGAIDVGEVYERPSRCALVRRICLEILHEPIPAAAADTPRIVQGKVKDTGTGWARTHYRLICTGGLIASVGAAAALYVGNRRKGLPTRKR